MSLHKPVLPFLLIGPIVGRSGGSNLPEAYDPIFSPKPPSGPQTGGPGIGPKPKGRDINPMYLIVPGAMLVGVYTAYQKYKAGQAANQGRKELMESLKTFEAARAANPNLALSHKPTLLLSAGVDQATVGSASLNAETASTGSSALFEKAKASLSDVATKVRDKIATWMASATVYLAAHYPGLLNVIQATKKYATGLGSKIGRFISIAAGSILALVAGGYVTGLSLAETVKKIKQMGIEAYVKEKATQKALQDLNGTSLAASTLSIIKWGFVFGVAVWSLTSMPWVIFGISALGALAAYVINVKGLAEKYPFGTLLAKMAAMFGTMIIKTAVYAGAKIAASISTLINTYKTKPFPKPKVPWRPS